MSTVIEKEERLLNDKYMNVYIGIPSVLLNANTVPLLLMK